MYCCIIAQHRHDDAVRELRQDRTVIKNKLLGQTLHGDGIYVTIFWTSDSCDGPVDLSCTCPSYK